MTVELKIKNREEINEEFKWNLEAMYENENEWEKDFKKIKELISDVKSFKGRINEGGEVLLEVLKSQDDLSRLLENVYTYAKMRKDEDANNSKYQELTDRATSILVEVEESASYIVPEILELDEKTIDKYLNDIYELKLYKHHLNQILRTKKHILSKEEEALIAQMGEIANASQNTYSMLNNADMKFGEIEDENGNKLELTHGRFIPLMQNKNRRVREDAFKTFYKSFADFSNTFTSTLSANVKKNIFYSKVRKYNSALEASVHKNNIPVDVYDNLIEAVHNNLESMHRYIKLRKKALNLEELHMYDLYTPIVKDVDMKIPFSEGEEIILKGLNPLGDEYCNTIDAGLNNRWIDIYENKGKRSGAYSWGTYDSYPYILLNYQDTVDDMFTLSHELGHSMHSYYTRETQEYIYGNYSIFVAEVASTTNEALLMDHMLKVTTDKNERLYLLNHYLEQFRGTVFRQTMFAEFEKLIHERVENGGALTKDYLCETYLKLNKKYYGDEIIVDDEIGIEWARIPHFYYNFYVYQYATGFSAATSLSQSILSEGKSAVDRYIDFLKSGSSDYPINVLKKAGVDMTTKEPVNNALKLFSKLVDEMEKLI